MDTHILLWLERQELNDDQLEILLDAADDHALFFSDISVWEIGVALTKRNLERRPDLKGRSLAEWFSNLKAIYRLQSLPISQQIALEAAEIPALYGSGDPGDCFLIATARVHHLTLFTRDARMLALAHGQPADLKVLRC